MTAPRTSGDNPVKPDRGARGALFVGAGILLSRVIGLVRTTLLASYLGTSPQAAAYLSALRIPNFLQNLLGEGVLSASFVPVYAELVGQGKREEADRLAGAIFGLLSLVVGVLVAVGILAAPVLVDVIAPGFEGETRQLTILLVRIIFPGTGMLVLSAWCLGVLNSHRRFFLSYASPVVWNGAIIVALVVFGGRTDLGKLAEYLAYGTVAGSLLQFFVQVPSVRALLGRFRVSVDWTLDTVRTSLRNFGPAVLGRGVVQFSAFVDQAIATLISTRVVAVVPLAQTIYLLPVSLFGMSVSVAELTEMSRGDGALAGGDEDRNARLRERLQVGQNRIAFFVVPSAVAFFVLGDVVAGAILQHGKFGPSSTRLAWLVLMGSALGLVASTQARLYSSAFYAMKNTRLPLLFASIRVCVGAALGASLALGLPALTAIPADAGAVGLTAGAGIAAWLEFLLLRGAMERRIGRARPPASRLPLLWGSALLSACAGLGLKHLLVRQFGTTMEPLLANWLPRPPALPMVVTALLVVPVFGLTYFGLTFLLKVPQSQAIVRKVLRLRRRA